MVAQYSLHQSSITEVAGGWGYGASASTPAAELHTRRRPRSPLSLAASDADDEACRAGRSADTGKWGNSRLNY